MRKTRVKNIKAGDILESGNEVLNNIVINEEEAGTKYHRITYGKTINEFGRRILGKFVMLENETLTIRRG